MISRTGPNKAAFTLIEVLAAVLILSVGIIGVIRAYVVLMSGIEASSFTVEASYLLKNKMADIERETIENAGNIAGNKAGRFDGDYAAFKWQEESSEVKVVPGKPKEIPKEALREMVVEISEGPKEVLIEIPAMSGRVSGEPPAASKESQGEEAKANPEVVLTKVHVSISSGNEFEAGRELNLYTYLEKRSR